MLEHIKDAMDLTRNYLLKHGPDADVIAEQVGVSRDAGIVLITMLLYRLELDKVYPYCLPFGSLSKASKVWREAWENKHRQPRGGDGGGESPEIAREVRAALQSPVMDEFDQYVKQMIDRFISGKDATLFAFPVCTKLIADLKAADAMNLLLYLRSKPEVENLLRRGNIPKANRVTT